MKLLKNFERSGKRHLLALLKRVFKTVQIKKEDVDLKMVKRILVVRQDSRLGNLVLMTPFLGILRNCFPLSEIDLVVSEGFESILELNPNINKIISFEKKKTRLMPFKYLSFIRKLRKRKYDLAFDVSDGRHFSFNNVLLAALSKAKYRIGFDRGDSGSFLNILVPVPPPNIYMAEAINELARFLFPEAGGYELEYYLSDSEKDFADEWLRNHSIMEFDTFFAIHPGGKGRKRWGGNNFAALISRIHQETGVKIVLIAGASEISVVDSIKELTHVQFEVLENATAGQMAAIIDRCTVFISGDTGPMHVASALKKPVIGIFISSNFHEFGPRGQNSRIVISGGASRSIEDVMIALNDILDN